MTTRIALLVLLAACWAFCANHRNVVFEGDSIFAGTVNSPGKAISDQCDGLSWFDGPVKNVATSGNKLTDLTNQFASELFPLTIGWPYQNWLLVNIGANDVGSFTNTWSTNSWFGVLTNYWYMARTSGYNVCAFTITDNNLAASDAESRLLLNEMIRGGGIWYDALVDTDDTIPDHTDTNHYIGGGVHPTDFGIALLATNVNTVLSTQYPASVPPRLQSAGKPRHGGIR